MKVAASAKIYGVLFLFFASQNAIAGESKIYLLEESRAGQSTQWCRFRSRAVFEAANRTAQPWRVATLFFSDNVLSKIEEATESESGDYIVYDNYLAGRDGSLTKLERQTNTFHGDATIVETYEIGGGKSRKRSTAVRDLETKKPVPKSRDVMFVDLPVRTELKSFPYFALIESAATQANAKLCVGQK